MTSSPPIWTVPCGDRLEAGNHPQQGGFAAAGGPEQRAELAAIDGQIEVLDRLDIAVALLDAPQLDFDHLVPQSWPARDPPATILLAARILAHILSR